MKIVYYHSSYDYYKHLFGKAQTAHDVSYIYGNEVFINNKILKFLYKVHTSDYFNRFGRIPFRSIWYKYLIPKDLNKKEEVCFIFNSSRVPDFSEDFFLYLRHHYNCKLVLQLGNPVESEKKYINIEKMKSIMDLVCTYNLYDVQHYGLSLHPVFLFHLEGIKVIPMKDRTNDFLFVGQDKGRLSIIEDLYDKLVAYGFKCNFYVVGSSGKNNKEGMHFCKWIPYSETVRLSENSKCIINILQPGAKGITLRDIEAYNYGSFLLTNGKSDVLNTLFNDGQVIDINNISSSIVTQIKERKTTFPRKETKETLDNYYDWIEQSLKKH